MRLARLQSSFVVVLLRAIKLVTINQMMLRIFTCWILTLSLSLPSAALTPVQTRGIQDFIRYTEITKKSVSWKKLSEQLASDLPLDVQREMKVYLKEFPTSQLPQATMTMLGSSENQTVQLEWNFKNEKVFLRFSGKSDFAEIESIAGKQRTVRHVMASDIKDPVKFIAELSGQSPISLQIPSVQILNAEQIKSLGEKQKRDYIDSFREMLAAAEKVQAASFKNKKVTQNFEILFNQLLEQVQAASPSGDCIVAGWVGQYRNNSCEAPANARAGGCAKCNIEIYGSDSPCLELSGGKLPINATEICNQKTESTKYSYFKGSKTEKDVQDKSQTLSGILTGLREKCTQIDAGVNKGEKLSDQSQACQNLNHRISDLESVQCQILEQDKGQFQDLKCHQKRQEQDFPAEVSETQAPGKAGAGGPAAGGVVNRPAESNPCTGLPPAADALRCQSAQVKQVQCEENGEAQTRFYCECGAGQKDIKKGGPLSIGCEESRPTSSRDLPSERRAKKSESWFKPWMGVAAAGLAALLLYYWMAKQTMKSQYSQWYSTTTNTPVPVTLTGTPTPAPTPVTIDRGTPTGTR